MRSAQCQAKHAMLVCLAVKEMNELRFVLVPKRLADEQFWAIYFALVRSRLPPEAFDVALEWQLQPEPEPTAKVLCLIIHSNSHAKL